MTTSALSAVLVAKRPVTVALTKPHDPDAFYKTRAGLYVSRSFRDRIVRHAKPTQSASPVTLPSFELDRDATDKKIEDELGANHEFTESEVCWILAGMIDKQEGGTAGDLDNTGKTKLFYTPYRNRRQHEHESSAVTQASASRPTSLLSVGGPYCVVDVSWSVGMASWLATAWLRDHITWLAGDSAFSRN